MLGALPWIGPTLVLIAAIVAFPVGYMLWTSTRDLSQYGQDRGPAGLGNFRTLFGIQELGSVLLHTVVWVVAVVGITLVLSAALAQFLNKRFPGRTAVRMAILVPWAASVVMTTTIFYNMLDPDVGIANRFFVDIGLLDRGYGFTKQPAQAFIVAIVVGVFVSIPFTTYTILAGLQSIPAEIVEAGRVDGASAWQRYWYLLLPQLRPAIAVATIINIINAFNSLPILKVLTGSIAGFGADTTTTLTFKLIQQNQQLDTAAAMSVLNFVLIMVIIAIYVKVIKPTREVDA
ncbi:sugar ABC transporter permease [Nocardia sp. NPDC048505]|uniref:carbohydrate ABC transporter permease n=1 Tax=unclassified Nocardia TaxID=2637762 RepID=UPI0033EF4FA3